MWAIARYGVLRARQSLRLLAGNHPRYGIGVQQRGLAFREALPAAPEPESGWLVRQDGRRHQLDGETRRQWAARQQQIVGMVSRLFR